MVSDGLSLSSLLRVDPGFLALWASTSTLLSAHALGRRQLNGCGQWHRPPTAMGFTLVHENKKPNSSLSFSWRKRANKTQPLPEDTASRWQSQPLLPGLCYQWLLGRGPALDTIISWCSVGSHPYSSSVGLSASLWHVSCLTALAKPVPSHPGFSLAHTHSPSPCGFKTSHVHKSRDSNSVRLWKPLRGFFSKHLDFRVTSCHQSNLCFFLSSRYDRKLRHKCHKSH